MTPKKVSVRKHMLNDLWIYCCPPALNGSYSACPLRVAGPDPSPSSALGMTISDASVLGHEALTKVADRQTGRSTLSKNPRLLALPLGDPDAGNRKFSSFKHQSF